MLKNFVKIAFRNLIRNKIYTLTSVLGLAIGISGATLITLYVEDEFSYDSYHENRGDIYRLTTILDFSGKKDVALTNYAAGPTLKLEYPEVKEFVRFFRGGAQVEISHENKKFNESNIWITDSSVFKVFSYQMIAGNPSTALVSPNSIVLTESLALKLFGDEKAMGREIKLNNSMVNVTGVIKDPPANSEISVNGLVSLTTMPKGFHQAFNQDWFRISFYTFLLCDKSINLTDFKSKLIDFEERHVQPWAEANGVTAGHEYFVTPLKNLHFDSDHEFDLPKGNKSDIIIFIALAVFLLLISSFNFINLTLAQQSKRAKEVGVRKTLGSLRKALIFQFLIESLLISLVALILGLAISELFMNQFNVISGKSIHILDVFNPKIILAEIAILLIVGVLGGSYPAFVLSRLQPTDVLHGGTSGISNKSTFRKVLITLQFVFSIFMITGTLLIGDQMDHIRSIHLGFDRNNLISVNLPADTAQRRQLEPWIQSLENNTQILAKSSTSLPSNGAGELMFRVEQEGKMEEQGVKFLFVDDNFIPVLGLKIMSGRNFSRDYQTEQTQAFIINERAAKVFGWEGTPLNKRVQWGLLANGSAQNDGRVVGVVNDFNFRSLHNELEPLILCYRPSGGRNLSIRLASGDYTQTLQEMEHKWNEICPGLPFDFSFFDDALNSNYVNEQNMYNVFTYFSALSIMLACIGLFALLSYSLEIRKKEIGIRKVLGATTLQLSWIALKDFVYLLLIAFVVASPINYYLMKNWQSGFAYQAEFNSGSYWASILFTIALSFLSVSYHIWSISRSNPVDSLAAD